MVDILGLAEVPVPSFVGKNAFLGINGTLFFSILIFAIGGCICIWLYWNWKIYNRKIVVFENISGQGYQPTFKDRARIVKLGDGGEEILFLKKKKVYRTAYGRKMGKNTYWFAVGQDGYWYNSILGDMDAKMGMLDIEPIDRDMRYMHVAIRKNIQDRYKSKKMLTATSIVVGGIVITVIIIFIGNWFLLDKISEIAGSVAGAVDAATKVQKETGKLLSGLDNVLGGSGLKPAQVYHGILRYTSNLLT